MKRPLHYLIILLAICTLVLLAGCAHGDAAEPKYHRPWYHHFWWHDHHRQGPPAHNPHGFHSPHRHRPGVPAEPGHKDPLEALTHHDNDHDGLLDH